MDPRDTFEWKNTWGNPDWKPAVGTRLKINAHIGHWARTYWGTVTRQTPKQFTISLAETREISSEGDGSQNRSVVEVVWADPPPADRPKMTAKFIRSGGYNCWCASERGEFSTLDFAGNDNTAEYMSYW